MYALYMLYIRVYIRTKCINKSIVYALYVCINRLKFRKTRPILVLVKEFVYTYIEDWI